jgi:hypothetical protein
MKIRKTVWLVGICTPVLLLGAQDAPHRFDGNWNVHESCEAHGQMPAYNWNFPGVVKDGVLHAQHSQEGSPGYLVIDGPINGDGSAKLKAKGTVSQSKASGVFAIKGNNYDFNIEARFTETSGTGTRDKGAGILGRPCTFEFAKQADAPAPPAQ